MKKKDLKDLRIKSISDLKKVLKEKRQQLAEIGIKNKTGEEKNLKKAKNLRIEIAQISTITGEKEILEKEGKIKK